ncbi:MAG: UDP-N-acetylmuramoyl-L-alanine--D-glutamate ligase [bacterium]
MFDFSDIEGKRVTVLGAGRSGLAAARLMARKGVHAFLSEKAPKDERRKEAEALSEAGIPAEFGGHTDRVFEADGIVVSPGISESSPLLQEAKQKGIPVASELELASRFCRARIVAVTGSNGKSTTTALLGEIFKTAGTPCVVAGNIGKPFSDFVDEIDSDGVAVLEVSSFQLETIRTFHPNVAVFLNLTPDHLDRHGTMEHYGRLKARLFENQTSEDTLVFNGKDERVFELSHEAVSRLAAFGVDEVSMDCGFVRDGFMMLRISGREESLLSVDDMRIRGEHNEANGLAAALAAVSMGVESEPIRVALRTFRGLSHRMEFIRELDGVEWVNDSKATNTDSVWYALGSFQNPIILIAGGRDKDSDFRVLRERIRSKTKGVVLLGEAADKMERAFRSLVPLVRADSLEDAVHKARLMAQSGDVVLLSPSCASFDMFHDFEDRGDQFKKLVRQLR